MTDSSIKRYSRPDLERLRDRSRADPPDGPSLGEAFWREAHVILPRPPKRQLTLRLDEDVVAWFRREGQGYQTRMNAVLRAYMDAHRR